MIFDTCLYACVTAPEGDQHKRSRQGCHTSELQMPMRYSEYSLPAGNVLTMQGATCHLNAILQEFASAATNGPYN